MKRAKKLGVWMDHSIAYLMEFTNNPFEIKTIEPEFPEGNIEMSLVKGDQLPKNIDKHILYAYYNRIGEAIKNYKQIVLFGPTDAKVELFDVLSEDYRFVKTIVEIKETDKMSVNQQHEFISKYFAEN